MANYILALGGNARASASSVVEVFKVTANGVEKITDHGLSLSVARSDLAAASCGDYILSLGGYGSNNYYDTVDVFHVTSNGVEKITEHGLSLSVARTDLAAASCGDYILSLGGHSSSNYYDTVDVFHVTSNGVEKITEHGLSLSVGRSALAAASCGDYILAMGGFDSIGFRDTVDVFHVTSNGVEKITEHGLSLSVGRSNLAAASCGEYVLAMGGFPGSSSVVDLFKVTANGVEQVTGHGLALSSPRQRLAAASCGDYTLAMGGRHEGVAVDTVDVFKRVVAQ